MAITKIWSVKSRLDTSLIIISGWHMVEETTLLTN